jgi:nitrate/nitrite-specific signal transduction histidine kinase
MRSVIVRPIVALSAVARRVGDGDFEARASAGARDEIGELGGAFNDMTSRLSRAHSELETKNKELETALQNLQESRQRVALLEQLKGELAKFVPDAVKKLLELNPNATELQKRTVEVSVVFLDTGYTKLSSSSTRSGSISSCRRISRAWKSSDHHGDVNETAGDGGWSSPVGAQLDDHAQRSRAAFSITSERAR